MIMKVKLERTLEKLQLMITKDFRTTSFDYELQRKTRKGNETTSGRKRNEKANLTYRIEKVNGG